MFASYGPSELVATREGHASVAQDGDRRRFAARPSPARARVRPRTGGGRWSASAASDPVGDVAAVIAWVADGPSCVDSADGAFFAGFASRVAAVRSASHADGSSGVDSGPLEAGADVAAAPERLVASAPALAAAAAIREAFAARACAAETRAFATRAIVAPRGTSAKDARAVRARMSAESQATVRYTVSAQSARYARYAQYAQYVAVGARAPRAVDARVETAGYAGGAPDGARSAAFPSAVDSRITAKAAAVATSQRRGDEVWSAVDRGSGKYASDAPGARVAILREPGANVPSPGHGPTANAANLAQRRRGP